MKADRPVLDPRWIPPVVALCATMMLAAVGPPAANDPSRPGLAGDRYIGANKCKNCHQSKSSGNQFGKWESTRHSLAYETLAGDKAREFGAARGIDDPQSSDQCLKCHVTAFGKPAERLDKSFKPEQGVQCESCHGPGERHFKARLAAAFDAEEEDEFGDEDAGYSPVPEGEIITRPEADTCLQCHNDESPAYKPFCFCEFMPPIRHLNPSKQRTPEQKAELETCKQNDECHARHGCDESACAVKGGAGG